ncbi:hypothetical protein C2S52_018720 [Perilla frutescens var. hirtella]|nr:hypothetical protein C2S52_018720 [Perilla frutescens var. hirtella]
MKAGAEAGSENQFLEYAKIPGLDDGIATPTAGIFLLVQATGATASCVTMPLKPAYR